MNKTSSFQFSSIIPFCISAAFMGSGFLYIYETLEKSSTIGMILGIFLSIGLNMLFYKLFNIEKKLTLVKKINLVFSKPINYIIIILLSFLLFTMGSLILLRLISFFSTEYLLNIPNTILLILMALLVFTIASKNFEIISRFTTITLFICIAIFIFNFCTLFQHLELTNILPIIDTSIFNILKTAIVCSVIFSGPSFMLLIIPGSSIIDQKNLKKCLIFNYTVIALMLIGIIFATLSTLGIEIIKLYIYPVYIVLKKIQVFEFINSIENISVLFWFFILITSSSLSFKFSKDIICEGFKIKNNNIVLILMLSIGSTIPNYFITQKNLLNKSSFIIFPIVIYSMFILFTIVYIITYKIKIEKKYIK